MFLSFNSIISWIYIIIIFINHHTTKSHKCAFDEIHENILANPRERSTNLTYNHYIPHLLSSYNDNKRRRNLIDSNYQKIRIVPYWEYLENVLSDRPTDLQFIKELVSAAIRYISQFVYIIPVQNNLTLLHWCDKWNIYDECMEFADYKEYCYHDSFAIPEQHFGLEILYNVDGSINRTVGGYGLSDADFVLYVSADSDIYCAGNTAGFAMPCIDDQYGRPIAGFIHICDFAMFERDWHEDMDVVLHEIFHTIIMSPYLWTHFIDNTFNPYLRNFISYRQVFGNGYIKTPRVKRLAQKHFDCNYLNGLLYDGGHWKANPLAFELMIGSNYNGLAYLSEFTLALMEDSGHYVIDYEYAMIYLWGKNQGCSFVINEDCFNKETHISNYPDFYCNQYDNFNSNLFQFDGCSFDHNAMAYCDIYRYPEDWIPDKYQWFDDEDIGGHQGFNYCPIRQPQRNKQIEPHWRGYCFDKRGYQLFNNFNDNFELIGFGENSKCLQAKNGYDQQFGACFTINCTEYNIETSEWNGIDIIMNGIADIKCNRNDINEWKLSSINDGIRILCPDIDKLCIGSNPLQCIRGHWSSKYNKCLCHAGYIGNQCSMKDTLIIPNLSIDTIIISDLPTAMPTNIPTDLPTDNPSYSYIQMPTYNPIKARLPTKRPTRRRKTRRPTRRIKR